MSPRIIYFLTSMIMTLFSHPPRPDHTSSTTSPSTAKRRTPSTSPKKNLNPTPALSSSSKARRAAPPIDPTTLSPPLTGPRDPRLTVAYLERLIDESGAEGRREVALVFGVSPAGFAQGESGVALDERGG